MKTVSQRISSLSADSLSSLLRKLENQSRIGIKPRNLNSGRAPLSLAQSRLLFISQFAGQIPYNIVGASRLSGKLKLAALEQGLNEIVRRHEALRTRFGNEGGEPVQMIEPEMRVRMGWVDVSGLKKEEREREVERLAREEGRRRFDLERGPLFRVTVIREGEEEHVLLLSLHHIISDGWSMGVLFGELEKLYGAYGSGGAGELEELPIQYADYAVWQREWLVGEVLEEQVKYWKEQLRGAPGLLELPTDRPRPPLQSYKGEVRNRAIGGEVLEAVKELSQKQGATLFMTLLAGLYVVLHRHSGAEDVVVGSPIANRNREETEGLIGFFVNTLALRVRVKGEESFAELLEGVKKAALGGYEHQDLPFEKLVEELQPERSLSYHPLFQVMFVLQNASEGTVRLPGLEVRGLRVEAEAAIFDLSLELREEKGELQARVLHNTDILEGETVERMLGHYERVLAEAARVPETKIRDLRLLDSTERQQIIVDWNRTSAGWMLDNCIHKLFEQQVQKTPNLLAVADGSRTLTYSELNRRANQLAHHLKKIGVTPDVPVALYLNSSQEMVVGALAVLKAGGAYVPMDPNYPVERLRFMLVDSTAQIVLTLSDFAEHLQSEAHVVVLDEWDIIGKESESNLNVMVWPENLAYIVYTSGSAGRPKGVAVSHSGFANLIQLLRHVYGLNSECRVSQFTAPGFDGWGWDVWPTLACGASLHIVGEALRRLPTDLMAWWNEQKITVALLPTSVLEALPRPWPTEMPLKLLFTGGDRLHPIAEQNNCQLINLYGPTEITVAATSHPVVYGDTCMPPIGRPLANMRVYVLDAQMLPVPVGVPGELYIGGVGLARGYWARPDLTASSFLPDPFSIRSGERLYRTGDIVRWNPSGKLEFLRRLDHQVKVRGYRIELGEIESVLKEYSGVRDCAVGIEETTGSGGQAKNVVAYIVLDSASVTVASLRSYLKQKLPEFMIPSTYKLVERLPLNAHGKVDRQLLSQCSVAIESRTVTSPPVTGIQGALAAIWSDVLNLDIAEVDIHDDFFAMGGHSLNAIKFISRINSAFHCKLPVKQMFQTSSIAELAEIIECAPKNRIPTAPTLKPRGRKVSAMTT
jgi:amino acid adenylation domain-containing protein